MGWVDDWAERWASRAAGPGPQHLPEPPRALTAAGTRVNLRKPDPAHTKHEQWQYESWGRRNTVPEMRFAGDFVASSLGRLRVFPAENRPRGEEPVPLEVATKRQQERDELGLDEYTRDAAIAATDRLNLNQHGTSLLSRYAENLEFAGQGYLLGERDEHGEETWSIRSILECQLTTGGGRLVDPVSGMQQRELRDDECSLYKLWNPDPAFYNQADAPVRGVLSVLRAMDLINQRGIAHDQSRISAGKGLFIPQELLMISAPAAVAADLPGVVDDPMSSDFMSKLIEYMTLAINNVDDPSAIVPLMLTGAATIDGVATKDLIGTFDLHNEDPKGLDERYELLTMRFARGINLAPERIKGIAESSNQWNAVTVTAEEVKTSIEPRAERMCDSLTAAYLHPTLLRMGVPPKQVAKTCLWFDSAELVMNPNRGEDAKTLFQAGELSGEALRRSTGFTDSDKPSMQERLLRALTQGELANASVPALLKLAAGQLPTVADLTAVEQAQARMNTPRPVVDATPNRGAPPAAKQVDATPPVRQREQPKTASQPGALGASSGTVTAAAKPKQWKLDRKLGQRLVAIDRDLTVKITAQCDAVLGRVQERAANKIRAAQGREKQRQATFPTGSDPRVIVAAAGRKITDLSDDELVGDALDELSAFFHAEVSAAADAVEQLLDRHLEHVPKALTASGGRGVADAIRARSTDAWMWLSSRLRRRATGILFGERDPGDTAVTPTALVRGALAKVGGLPEMSRGVQDDGTLAGGHDAGLANGDVVLGRLRQVGALTVGRSWEYPRVPRRHFTPHRRLDDVVFDKWNDDQLAVLPGDDWIGTHYYPSDHPGCLCYVVNAVVLPLEEGADPASDEVARLRAEALGS